MNFAVITAALLLSAGPVLASEGDAKDLQAQRNYLQYCSGCHLQDGMGKPNKGIPAMKDKVGRFLDADGGRAFIVQVPGVMNTPLSDAQIADLMNWVLRGMAGSSTPPHTAPYTTAEVAQLRASRPADVPATRALIVERLRATGVPQEQLP